MNRYRITFTRVGRRHNVDPVEFDSDGPNHLSEQIHGHIRRFMISRWYEVHVDLDRMDGHIYAGMNNGGSFTIAAVGGA